MKGVFFRIIQRYPSVKLYLHATFSSKLSLYGSHGSHGSQGSHQGAPFGQVNAKCYLTFATWHDLGWIFSREKLNAGIQYAFPQGVQREFRIVRHFLKASRIEHHPSIRDIGVTTSNRYSFK